jgi:hypothetical protein
LNLLDVIRDEVKKQLGGGHRKRVPTVFVMATIDPVYTTGRPNVIFDDDSSRTATGPYPYVSSYTPSPNDRVLLARVGVSGKFVVVGKVV